MKHCGSSSYMIFNCSYTCTWAKKMIVSKSDMAAQIDANVKTKLTIKCTATGNSDKRKHNNYFAT